MLFYLSVVALVCFAVACHAPAKPPIEETMDAPTKEPETYAATIVRSIEDSEGHQTTKTRVFRAGDMRREEWTAGGERLALITRYDLGKSYLLNLDKQIYSESDHLFPQSASNAPPQNSQTTPNPEESNSAATRQTAAMDFLEDDFSQAPLQVETRALPDESVANQLCKVVERRATFADGRLEITKIFRAVNETGLALKTEMESRSQNQHSKITIEWRDLTFAVPDDAFNLPANFKKVSDINRPIK